MTRKARAVRFQVPDLWEHFCEQLKHAGRVIHRETTPKDSLILAEGYRKLVHLIRMGFEATHEFADTEYPSIYQSVTATTLGEGETSDARYHQAFIDGTATYRVTGTRGDAPLIEFGVYAGKIGIQDVSRQVGALTEHELLVAADGSFEIVVGPDKHSGNWLRTTPDTTLLYIRQYAHDWSNTTSAMFSIQKAGPTTVRKPLTLDSMRKALARTALFVDKAACFWAEIIDRRATGPRNIFFEVPATPDPSNPLMPFAHRLAAGYFRLAAHDALVVRFTPTEVSYWGLDLTNYWLEPLSYDDHRSHVNNRTAAYGPDGSVCIVIASERRGASNWIDTLGHREGLLIFRWSRSSDPLPELTMQVVELSALPAVVDCGSRRVTCALSPVTTGDK